MSELNRFRGLIEEAKTEQQQKSEAEQQAIVAEQMQREKEHYQSLLKEYRELCELVDHLFKNTDLQKELGQVLDVVGGEESLAAKSQAGGEWRTAYTELKRLQTEEAALNPEFGATFQEALSKLAPLKSEKREALHSYRNGHSHVYRNEKTAGLAERIERSQELALKRIATTLEEQVGYRGEIKPTASPLFAEFIFSNAIHSRLKTKLPGVDYDDIKEFYPEEFAATYEEINDFAGGIQGDNQKRTGNMGTTGQAPDYMSERGYRKTYTEYNEWKTAIERGQAPANPTEPLTRPFSPSLSTDAYYRGKEIAPKVEAFDALKNAIRLTAALPNVGLSDSVSHIANTVPYSVSIALALQEAQEQNPRFGDYTYFPFGNFEGLAKKKAELTAANPGSTHTDPIQNKYKALVTKRREEDEAKVAQKITQLEGYISHMESVKSTVDTIPALETQIQEIEARITNKTTEKTRYESQKTEVLNKSVSRFIGYTEGKKQEELGNLNQVIARCERQIAEDTELIASKREELRQANQTKYSSQGYGNQTDEQKIAGYQKTIEQLKKGDLRALGQY